MAVVGVVAKHARESAIKAASELVAWLQEKKVSYLIGTETADALASGSFDIKLSTPREDLAEKCDVIVVLGGDGTLISACRHPASKPPIVIGVNLGTLGFLTEISIEEVYSVLQDVLDGKAKTDRRVLLSAKVSREGKEVSSFSAINDVVVTKEALARIFEIDVSINGETAASIKGDGVIVATPSGSTAYSLAAGGSIVHPQVDSILITPIAAHSLTLRPLVIPGSSTISLKVVYKSKEHTDKVYLTIDGQQGMVLANGDEISITTSKHSVFFVKSPTSSYYEILGEKLNWAAT